MREKVGTQDKQTQKHQNGTYLQYLTSQNVFQQSTGKVRLEETLRYSNPDRYFTSVSL